MGLTGIIYGSIVVAWAAYLIPLALRRHDEATRARSIDRFSSTMNVLARHGRAGASRVVVTPPRACARMLSPGSTRTGSTAAPTIRRPSAAARRAAARRRRRVLSVLTVVFLVVSAAAVLKYLPLWSPAVPAVLIGAFLVLARRQVRRASDASWVGTPAPTTGPTNVIRRGSSRVDASHGAVRPADDEPTVPLDRNKLLAAVAALEQEHTVAVSLPASDGTSLWDPLPVVLPTYVEKATASAGTRTIDLGTSTSRTSASIGEMNAATDLADSEVWADHSGSTSVDSAAQDVAQDLDEEEPAQVVNG